MNAHYPSISSAQSRITSIDEQLERLRTAKKSVSEIQQNVHNIKYPIMHRNIQLNELHQLVKTYTTLLEIDIALMAATGKELVRTDTVLGQNLFPDLQ